MLPYVKKSRLLNNVGVAFGFAHTNTFFVFSLALMITKNLETFGNSCQL